MSAASSSYKAFISYRRDGGAYIARIVAQAIRAEGQSTFIDQDELRGGDFNVTLDRIIADTPNFILIVSRNAFERVTNEGDWMHRELATALRHGKRVIPVFEQGVEFPDPRDLPEDIRDVVRQNGVHYSPQFHADVIRRIISNFESEQESEHARRSRIRSYFRDRMISIPEGTFMMGSTNGRPEEAPPHEVSVSSFWMMKYPMTQREYKALMKVNPGNFQQHVDNPVQNVSWFDAVRCCNKWSERDRLTPVYRLEGESPDGSDEETVVYTDFAANGYRLPTEAEWEYACRAGSTTDFHWGDSPDEWDRYAWHDRNSDDRVHVVGMRKPNRWGLYDMTGQVFEWCNDWFDADYYEFAEPLNPRGPGDSVGEFKVMRGGAWAYDPLRLRSAARLKRAPGLTDDVSGFRCVIGRHPLPPTEDSSES